MTYPTLDNVVSNVGFCNTAQNWSTAAVKYRYMTSTSGCPNNVSIWEFGDRALPSPLHPQHPHTSAWSWFLIALLLQHTACPPEWASHPPFHFGAALPVTYSVEEMISLGNWIPHTPKVFRDLEEASRRRPLWSSGAWCLGVLPHGHTELRRSLLDSIAPYPARCRRAPASSRYFLRAVGVGEGIWEGHHAVTWGVSTASRGWLPRGALCRRPWSPPHAVDCMPRRVAVASPCEIS